MTTQKEEALKKMSHKKKTSTLERTYNLQPFTMSFVT
jgi:hypothetical protein